MFTSTAEVFRRRQAISDLISVVRSHRSAMARLGVTPEERDGIARVIASGCLIRGLHQDRIASQLLLIAALPDDDFPAFITATAILVANRLSGGYGDDNLYWNWDAFQEHYRLADAPVRAALMNGFLAMDKVGLVTLDGGPSEADCLTRQETDVLASLPKGDSLGLASAIASDLPEVDAGRLWRKASGSELPSTMQAGFRYLYERPRSIEPDLPSVVPLIPWG